MKPVFLAFATALSLAATAGLAQQPAQQPTPQHGGGPMPGRAMPGHQMTPAEMAERYAQHLRDLLQLRADQEPALQALMTAMRPAPGEAQQMRQQRQAERGMTTPERLDRMQARMTEREARFRQHAEAIKRFYAQLTPPQQKAFDAMHMMGDGMGMGHRGGRGHDMGAKGMGHGGHGMTGQPPKPPTP